ncbi:hypothetical protein MPSEU_000199600 [Mayamaea pseudoterrestris]|nr:hypothetical protein MPSEU_000199600 [Mayamaea pseudoterrestris]
MLACLVTIVMFQNGASARSVTSPTVLFAAARDNHQQYTRNQQPWRLNSIIDLRGGGGGQPVAKTEPNVVSKKRRRKKSSSSSSSQRIKTNAPEAATDANTDPSSIVNHDSSSTTNKTNRHEINKTLLQQDPAQFLGDTIRQRGDELLLQRVSRSVNSLKWGLGASDYDESLRQQTTTSIVDDDNDNDAASLVSPTAVIAQYFVTSHGGAHAFQTLCSLLATLAGLGAVWTSLTLTKSSVTAASVTANDSSALAAYATRLHASLSLVRRACQWAMVQHFAGMLAAAVLAAQAVPVVGLRQARGYVHGLVKDPLAQYVFVSASILAWLPSRQSNNAAGAAAANLEWWMTQSWTRFVPIILVGPILIREVVSIGLVISDVLVLSTLGSSQSDSSRRTIQTVLTVARYVTDACMSLLVTPSVWKNANAAQRQEILAKLTSRVSLVLELAIGALMAVDAVWTIFGCLVFASSQQRPALTHVAKRILCAHLFWVFLSTRRRKIHRLVTSMRGGAAQLPFYVLNVLLHPRECMGLDDAKDERLAPPLEIVEENKLPRRKWKSVFEALLAVDEGS